MLFHSVTCYTNSIVSRIHVKTTKLCNVTGTLVATGVILRSLGCIMPCSFIRADCHLPFFRRGKVHFVDVGEGLSRIVNILVKESVDVS